MQLIPPSECVCALQLRGDRATVGLSAATVFAVMAWAPTVNIVLKATLALVAGFSVLLYRSLAVSRTAGVAGQVGQGHAGGGMGAAIEPPPVQAH